MTTYEINMTRDDGSTQSEWVWNGGQFEDLTCNTDVYENKQEAIAMFNNIDKSDLKGFMNGDYNVTLWETSDNGTMSVYMDKFIIVDAE